MENYGKALETCNPKIKFYKSKANFFLGELIDKNKLSKDIEKQEKGILKFDEDDEEEDEYN